METGPASEMFGSDGNPTCRMEQGVATIWLRVIMVGNASSRVQSLCSPPHGSWLAN